MSIDRNTVFVTDVSNTKIQQVSVGYDLYEISATNKVTVKDCTCGNNADEDCDCFVEYRATIIHPDGTTEECDRSLTSWIHGVAWEKENV